MSYSLELLAGVGVVLQLRGAHRSCKHHRRSLWRFAPSNSNQFFFPRLCVRVAVHSGSDLLLPLAG